MGLPGVLVSLLLLTIREPVRQGTRKKSAAGFPLPLWCRRCVKSGPICPAIAEHSPAFRLEWRWAGLGILHNFINPCPILILVSWLIPGQSWNPFGAKTMIVEPCWK